MQKVIWVCNVRDICVLDDKFCGSVLEPTASEINLLYYSSWVEDFHVDYLQKNALKFLVRDRKSILWHNQIKNSHVTRFLFDYPFVAIKTTFLIGISILTDV